MTNQEQESSGYTMGYSPEFSPTFGPTKRRSHAGHLLRHLKPGDRVLDFGCGPGTISVGLAKAVEPGEIHGIDIEESQVLLARGRRLRPVDMPTRRSKYGNVTDLPFEDGYFDAAHCHAVLMHVPDTHAALARGKASSQARRCHREP